MEEQEGDLEMVELTTPSIGNQQSLPGLDHHVGTHSRKQKHISYAKYASLRKAS